MPSVAVAIALSPPGPHCPLYRPHDSARRGCFRGEATHLLDSRCAARIIGPLSQLRGGGGDDEGFALLEPALRDAAAGRPGAPATIQAPAPGAVGLGAQPVHAAALRAGRVP